jgi:membrane glycosyltransferase
VELASLREPASEAGTTNRSALIPPDSGLVQAILDPYVNAIHVSLLREKELNPEYRAALARLGAGKPGIRSLGEKLLSENQDALKPDEKLLVLSDGETMSWLHRQAWLRPTESLAPWWQAAIRQTGQ